MYDSVSLKLEGLTGLKSRTWAEVETHFFRDVIELLQAFRAGSSFSEPHIHD